MKNFQNIPKPFIVAEIGNNHEGSVFNAIKMIEKAKDCGANAVKFQIFNPYKYASPKDEKRILQLKKFALKKKDIIKLKKKCDELDILFFATPFDIKSAMLLNQFQDFFKISSGDNNYLDLLDKVRSFKKPVIISTGLMDHKEISKLIKFFKKNSFYNKKKNICLMHCVSAYPASKKNINLNSITYLKKKYPNVTIGYSDHTLGHKISCLSFVLGAEIIEKHFTLSNNFSNFRDHKISLNPKNFKNFVKEVKKLKIILGGVNKYINDEEKKNIYTMRRKIISNMNLNINHKIKKNDLLIVRSTDEGILASDMNKIIGKKINRKVFKYENFLLKDFT